MDVFRIPHIYPTNSEVRQFDSKYWTNKKYNLLSTQIDPLNPIVRKRGNGGFEVDDGILTLSGSAPRIYANYDWKDTEVSVYYKRIGTDGKNSQGMIIGHRSLADGHTSGSSDMVHCYYTKINHLGKTSVYKEEYHNSVDGKRRQWYGSKSKIRKAQQYFDKPLKTDDWLGVKSICYDLENGSTRIELWIDTVSKGIQGLFKKSNWKMIDWFEDDNENFGGPNFHGKKGSILIRNGGIKAAHYKNFSIREIAVQSNSGFEIPKLTIGLKNNSQTDFIIKSGEKYEVSI